MDYEANPITRKDIREMARYFRRIYEVDETGPFPVLMALEHLFEKFPGSYYEVVEDKVMPENTMARCIENDNGGYIVQIKGSVYDRAFHDIGADRGYICHELCHVFLFSIGYKPVIERSFSSKELCAYRSVEWQAKALCGEAMIPFRESQGMSVRQIVEKYHVSWESAKYRLRLK